MIIKKLTTPISERLYKLLVRFFTINILIFSGVAQSATVYSQNPLAEGDGPASYNVEHSADNFSLSADTTITGIQWWGSFFDDSISNNSFDIRFFNDNGGFPSSSSFEQFTVDAPRSSTGLVDVFGGEVFLFDVALTPFNLLANTPYYVSIVHPDDAIDDEFYWLQSDDTGQNFSRDTTIGPAWEGNQGVLGNLAFSLLGTQVATVPEPNTIILITLAFFGLSFYRSRIKI